MNTYGNYWLAAVAVVTASLATGCAHDVSDEPIGHVSAAQFDPGEKSYTIYTLMTDQIVLAKVLATNDAVGDYAAVTEHWRFNSAGLSALGNLHDIEVSSLSYWQSEHDVDTMWPPSGAGFASNDLMMPTDVFYGPLQHQVSKVYEAQHSSGFDVRLALDIEMDAAGEASGEITLYHGASLAPRYLLEPETNITMQLDTAADWSTSTWSEYHFDSNQ